MFPRANGNRPALIMAATGETVSYRELDERSSRLARLLRARGLGRGDVVAVLLENPRCGPWRCIASAAPW